MNSTWPTLPFGSAVQGLLHFFGLSPRNWRFLRKQYLDAHASFELSVRTGSARCQSCFLQLNPGNVEECVTDPRIGCHSQETKYYQTLLSETKCRFFRSIGILRIDSISFCALMAKKRAQHGIRVTDSNFAAHPRQRYALPFRSPTHKDSSIHLWRDWNAKRWMVPVLDVVPRYFL